HRQARLQRLGGAEAVETVFVEPRVVAHGADSLGSEAAYSVPRSLRRGNRWCGVQHQRPPQRRPTSHQTCRADSAFLSHDGRPTPATPGGQERRCPHGYRSEEHTSELQSRENLVCRLLLEKKNNN